MIEIHATFTHLAPAVEEIFKGITWGLFSRILDFIDRETSHDNRNGPQYSKWNDEGEKYRPAIPQYIIIDKK